MKNQSLDTYTENNFCEIFSIQSVDASTSSKEIHRHSFYQIFLLKKGKIRHNVDFEWKECEAPYISVLFPNQVHRMELSEDAETDIIMFDSSIFCSALLANELKEYNIDLKKRLNHITEIPENELQAINSIILQIKKLSGNISMIKKLEIKFLIKIILLKAIDMAPVFHTICNIDKDLQIYQKFMEMLNNEFVAQKKVYAYAQELGITTKKLGIVCYKYTGHTPLELVHERLSMELKRTFLEEGLMLKEIAFRLGFSSQSALNKYIEKEFGYTPQKWKEHLESSMLGKFNDKT